MTRTTRRLPANSSRPTTTARSAAASRAPRDRLTGRMSLQVQDGPSGSTSFNVEEYKRPKFQVELTTPKEAATLNAEVRVLRQGHRLHRRGHRRRQGEVSRGARSPVSSVVLVGFGIRPPGRGTKPGHRPRHGGHGNRRLLHGGIHRQTRSVRAEKDEPTFEFTVYADVTDTTGETRSAQRSVRVGYTALQATLSANEWQTPDKPVAITVDTKTLDGEGQAAAGTVKVYALKQPTKVERPELDSRHQHSRCGVGHGQRRRTAASKPICPTRTHGNSPKSSASRRSRPTTAAAPQVSLALKARHLPRDARHPGPLRQGGDGAIANPGR